MALATETMSESVASCLNELMHQRTKRQLASVYPSAGSIRSMLGDQNLGPEVRWPRRNGRPVTSQNPVHLEMHHISVSSNGTPFLTARSRALRSNAFQGTLSRVC